MKPGMISIWIVLTSLILLGLYITIPPSKMIKIEPPLDNPSLEVEKTQETVIQKPISEKWSGGAVREFYFNCSPGERPSFRITSIREGTSLEITSKGYATVAVSTANLPSRCFFRDDFACTDHTFNESSFRLRLKNLALSKIDVKKFIMTNSSGQECEATI